ncbi:hypothetical protein GUJ93_ZPchr0003g18439 [Zizania palustris]|uniref:Condensin complex subunit 1 C-terminal domain-containing protein n=1 Tax=Zizania palustris TaxID=103762 RepID=A0A8J5SV12_ZIZPA|nr:hypothetical protein GUJ93_ZPchr0003g18439 [Zizania palustris]
MLSSFLDQDSIVRYYVCEALYNIAKTLMLIAHSDVNVQSAAHLLDRLVKVRSERRQVESTRTREKYLDKIHVIVEKAHKTDVP